MADYLLPEENDSLVAASSINRALTGGAAGGVHWGYHLMPFHRRLVSF